MKKLFLLLALAPQSAWAAPAAADADFSARCDAPGVTLCVGFDNFSTDIQPFLDPVWNTSIYRGSFDSSQAASGAGSLRFEIPPFTGEDTSGNWSARMGDQFGQGEKFYVQFRQRFSPEFLNERMGGDGWKQIIFYMDGGPSCGNIELATLNAWQRGYPSMYTDCGNRLFQLNIGNNDFLNQWTSDWPANKHPNQWVECHYLNEKAPPQGGCFYYKPNDWMTFYYEVEIGNWGQPNSKVRAYVGYAGGQMYQFVNAENFRLSNNGSNNDHYSRVLLLPFNTNKPSDRDHATAYTWYDELIVSKNPIAPPGGGAISQPPTNQPPSSEQPNSTKPGSEIISKGGRPIRIPYELARPSHVIIDIYNRNGKMVMRIEDSNKPAGKNEVVWDLRGPNGSKVASGIYLFKFNVDGEPLKTEKTVVVK